MQPRRERRSNRRRCRSEDLEVRLAMTAGPLVITEVMYNAAAPSAAEDAAGWKESDFEFVELKNLGSDPLLLTNYALSQGAGYTFGAVTIGAGEFIVVAKNLAAFTSRYGSVANVVGNYSGTLGNGGDDLTLKNPAGTTTLSFTFDDAWYPTTDGSGYSLVIINPQAPTNTWGQSTSWQPSVALGGSPGRAEGPVDATPPSAPQSLTGSVVTPTRVDLTWQAAIDPESGISSYRVYRDNVLLGTTTSLSYSDTTALPNSTYSYQVLATNPFAGQSPRSNTAVVTIAPLSGDPAFAAGQELNSVTGTDLREASGIVASRRNPDVLYVNNDGAKTALHLLNSQGDFLGKLTLSGVNSVDWEDIAIGPGPVAGTSYVFVGDIGDNDSNRTSIAVHRFAEPAIGLAGTQNITLTSGQYTTINLRFPDGSYDAETLLADPLTGDLFVITKSLATNRIYRASAAALAQGGLVTMTFAGSLNFATPSGGDISADGSEILIRHEDVARLYVRSPGQTIAQALASAPFAVPVIGTPDEPNGEAIGFAPDGRGYYTISEGTSPPLYYFHRTSRAPGQVIGAQVVARQIFYNNSAFDSYDPAASASDDLAIATDKQALLPGGTASFANYTSYSRGINGVMIDIQNLTSTTLTAADFRFAVGNSNQAGSWAAAPAPTSIVVRSGAGQNGADRVELVWADHAITGVWLQVTVLASGNTGLAAADTFYFGNEVGESGNAPSNTLVNSTDEIAARMNNTGVSDLAAINSPYDFDRDRHINATDQILARSNATTLATALRLIIAPSSTQLLAAPAALEFTMAPSSLAAVSVSSVDTTSDASALGRVQLGSQSFDAGKRPQLAAPTEAARTLASTDQGFASLSAGDLKSLEAEAIDGDELFDLLAGARRQ